MKANQKAKSDVQSQLDETHEKESLLQGEIDGKDREVQELKRANAEMEEKIKALEAMPKGGGGCCTVM